MEYPLCRTLGEGVEWAVDALAVLFQDVQVLLGGLEVLVAQQLLDAPQVLAVLQQVRSERVAQGMAGGTLRKIGIRCGLPDRTLDWRPGPVVPFGHPVLRVGGALGRGKHVVPGPRGGGAARRLLPPFGQGVGIFLREGVRERCADVVDLIGVVASLHAAEVLLQGLAEAVGEDRGPVLCALAVPHDDAALWRLNWRRRHVAWTRSRRDEEVAADGGAMRGRV